MKCFFAFSLLLVSFVGYGQSSLPITLTTEGYNILIINKDSITIDGVYPVSFNLINYRIHQYDEVTGIHYWGFGYTSGENGCARMDQELGLWISEKAWYFVYTDYCVGIIIFKGPSDMSSYFRASLTLPQSYDFKSK